MNAFALFGPAHLLGLLLIVAAVALVPVIVRRIASASQQRALAKILATVMLLQEFGKIYLRVAILDLPLAESLPFHLCGAALILTAILLWRQSYRVYEVAYFWAMGGSIPALLTPDLPVDFPHPAFIAFFLGHGLVLLGIMYATVVFQFRPQLRSVGLAIGTTVGYALIMIPVNLTLEPSLPSFGVRTMVPFSFPSITPTSTSCFTKTLLFFALRRGLSANLIRPSSIEVTFQGPSGPT